MRTSYEKNKLVMSRGNWEISHQWECWDLGERNQEFPLGENSFSTIFSRSLQVVFDLCEKCILWINSSKRIKKTTTCDFALWDGISFWSFWNAWAKSVIKVSLYNCLTQGCSQTAAFTSESNDSIYYVSSARSETQVIFHIWKFVYSVAYPSFQYRFTRKWLFCSLWLVGWKRCLSANVLCDIPILRIS